MIVLPSIDVTYCPVTSMMSGKRDSAGNVTFKLPCAGMLCSVFNEKSYEVWLLDTYGLSMVSDEKIVPESAKNDSAYY